MDILVAGKQTQDYCSIKISEQPVQEVETYAVMLTDIQQTAVDLYERGFNVFPLPSGSDWKLRADENGKVSKHPFPVKMAKLHGARLYYDGKATGMFVALFVRANIGVMCGRTSGNLFYVDCETLDAYNYVRKELDKNALPYWAYTTGKGGGFWMRLIEGEAKNVPLANSKIKDVEIWGNAHYCVAPPSVHPNGTFYTWQTPEPRVSIARYQNIPAVSVEQVEWLGVVLKDEPSEYCKPDGHENVPDWAKNMSDENLHTWMYGAELGSRATSLLSLASYMAGQKMDSAEAYEILCDVAEKCDPPFTSSDEMSNISRIINWVYKQEDDNDDDDRPKRSRHWNDAVQFANSFDWNSLKWFYEDKSRGKCSIRSSTVKRVFLALIERAKLDGRKTFRATVRELSSISTLGKNAVMHGLDALINNDIIKSAGKADDGSSLYQFKDYSKKKTLIYTSSNSVSLLEYSLPKTNAEKDVFGSSNGMMIWRYLIINPTKTPYKLAKELGLSQSGVYNTVKKLQSMGLVTYNQDDGLYYGETKTDSSLEMLSMDMVSANGKSRWGKSQARDDRYKLDREIYLLKQFISARNRYEKQSQELRAKLNK